jgi:HEAT repeat protein
LFLSPEHRRVLEGEIGSLNAISELDPWKLFQKAPPRLKDLAILRLSLQGKSVLPWFQEILKTSQGELKKTVILALGKMSISCPEAQELFQEVLQEDAPEIRIPTLYALGENTLLAQKHLPFIVHSLSEPEDDLRIHATRILEQIGAEAQVAVPALEAILQDENPFIREQAKNALRTITGKEISEQALRSSSGFPRKRVLGFSVLLGILLILYSYSEEWMYPLFVKARLALMLISESNYYQQREITLAIGNADQGRLQSLGVLIQDLQHAKWGVRLRAVRHLAYYKESSALIIPPLCESLQDPHWTVRYASIQSLEQLAQGDVQVLSLLEKLQKKEEEPDEYVRRAAKKAWLHLQRSQNPKQKKNR